MTDRALRSRILGIIVVAIPAACEEGGTGGDDALGPGCYEDVEGLGVCCVDPDPHCFTPEEVIEQVSKYGAGGWGSGGGPADCPALDRAYVSDCEWLTGSPTLQNGTCCYTFEGGSCCGRPFIVGGAQLVAAAEPRSDWSGLEKRARPPEPALIDAQTRRLLAREWLADGLLEHASIAAFARFTLQLMQLGAPRELVEASQKASLDELAHAEACFAQATRFGGEPIGPGPLDVAGALAPASLQDITALVVIEGCVGETAAASLASTALAVARDREAVTALRRIANDEAEHAALAWRFVAWAITQGGAEVAGAARNAFDRALGERAAAESTPHRIDVAVLHRHGRLTVNEKAAAQARALETVVRPCAHALLARVGPPPSFPRVSAGGA